MRKDDIIEQKLFETCKLSEFYLNLIVNSKFEDESPLQLTHAYTQKLYEIVERYDRLLDANKQREQLSLTFDRQLSATTKQKPPTPTVPLSRTSTPSKCFNLLNNLPTPGSSCQSYPSTPNYSTMPAYASSFLKQSPSNSSLNQQQRMSFSKKATYKSYFARQLNNIKTPNSKLSHEHSINLNKRIAAIYYDEYDDEEEPAGKQQQTVADMTPVFLSNDLLLASTISSPETTSSSSSTAGSNEYNTSSHENYDNESNNSQNIGKSYSNLSKDSGVFADSYHSEYAHNATAIVAAKETHKNASACADGEGEIEANTEYYYNENDYNDNLHSPSSDDLVEQDEDANSNEEDDKIIEEETDKTEDLVYGEKPKTHMVWGHVNRSAESSPVKKYDQRKASDVSLSATTTPTKMQSIPLPPNSLKEKFLSNKLMSGNNSYSKTYMLRPKLKGPRLNQSIKYLNDLEHLRSKASNSFEGSKRSLNLNVDLDYELMSKGLDTGLMSMMIESSESINQNELDTTRHRLENINENEQHDTFENRTSSNLSLCSTISTPSPSSTYSTASSTSTSTLPNSNSNYDQHNSTLTSVSTNNLSSLASNSNSLKQQQQTPFFFNYNSLMNVSMLDNIQATNTNLDNMNSSILMFN